MALDGAEDGLDVTMGEAAIDEEGLGGGEELLAGEGAADEVGLVELTFVGARGGG